MNFLNKKSRKIIKEMAVATLQKVEVSPGHCRYNHRCQYNAVHDAINNKEDRIAMCLCISGNYPCIHFLNVDKKNRYTDNTLGHWSTKSDYYLVRYIEKESFFNVDKIFSAYQKEIRNKLPFWVRFLSDFQF